MSVEQLAFFFSQARGIKFYDFLLSEVVVGVQFLCQLEPHNTRDSNCVALWCSHSRMLGHLAREASTHLAPLLRNGFTADG